jgi:microcystin-dependent protein
LGGPTDGQKVQQAGVHEDGSEVAVGLFPGIGDWSEAQLEQWAKQRFPQLAMPVNPSVAAGAGSRPGEIKLWPVATPPDGFVLCDGTEYNSDDSTYYPLYRVLGTTFNTGGEAASGFRVPDFEGRVPVGLGSHADVSSVTDNDGLAAAARTPRHSHHKAAFDTGRFQDTLALAGENVNFGGDFDATPWTNAFKTHTHQVPAFDTDSAAPPYQTVAVIIAL